jgi:pimeloyl-ACP methyl ester carboxylesterase
MPHIEAGERRMYHELHGTGDPLVLLHGGFCSIETMRLQIEDLSRDRAVYAPERPGHGRTADDGEPFTYERMAAGTIDYMDAAGVERADLVGFSDGAVIGLLLARDHPDRVRSLAAISGNLSPAGSVPPDEAAAAFGDEALAALFADYDRLSPDGPEHRQAVWERVALMWDTQPDIDPASLGRIRCPVLVMAADRDVISLGHTVSIRDAIPGARLCVVPGATHMLLAQRPDVVSAGLRGLLLERD